MFHNRFLLLAAAGAFGFLSVGTPPAGAAVITFDDLTTEDPTDDFVPRQTGGFDFGPDAFSLISDSEYMGPIPVTDTDPSGFGNSYGSPSGAYAAFNTDGIPFLLIGRGARFNFTGADFASKAERNAFGDFSARTITARGFRGTTAVGEVTAPLSPNGYAFLSANLSDVDQVAFIATGATAGADAFYVFDNFTFAEVPEPAAAWAALAFGSSALLRRRRRRCGGGA